MALARARCSFRRSVSALGIRSGRSHFDEAAALTRALQRYVLHWRPFPSIRALRCELFWEMSDRHKPSKLIKNQNASTINADKLNLKTKETIISAAPAAFSSEYLGDELGSLSSCRSK